MIWLRSGRLCKEGLLWVVWGELWAVSMCAPGRNSTWIWSQRVILGLQSVSGKGLQGEEHTGMQNNTEEWGMTPVLEHWRRNTLLVLRCRNNAFPGSCRLQKPELPGLHLHNSQGHPAARSTGMARLGAKSVSTRAHRKGPLEAQPRVHLPPHNRTFPFNRGCLHTASFSGLQTLTQRI